MAAPPDDCNFRIPPRAMPPRRPPPLRGWTGHEPVTSAAAEHTDKWEEDATGPNQASANSAAEQTTPQPRARATQKETPTPRHQSIPRHRRARRSSSEPGRKEAGEGGREGERITHYLAGGKHSASAMPVAGVAVLLRGVTREA
nr:unnamed protein product [Digitaria exilis]